MEIQQHDDLTPFKSPVLSVLRMWKARCQLWTWKVGDDGAYNLRRKQWQAGRVHQLGWQRLVQRQEMVEAERDREGKFWAGSYPNGASPSLESPKTSSISSSIR
ncbi:hypothetical protein ILYODFUR_026617 [Ilyodon furcidens]|uniref:Uncharacterized protein n=1 Tax=Ilyodon furcidens TaxID=33524 RepID=A0ABV0U8P9_9TELE